MGEGLGRRRGSHEVWSCVQVATKSASIDPLAWLPPSARINFSFIVGNSLRITHPEWTVLAVPGARRPSDFLFPTKFHHEAACPLGTLCSDFNHSMRGLTYSSNINLFRVCSDYVVIPTYPMLFCVSGVKIDSPWRRPKLVGDSDTLFSVHPVITNMSQTKLLSQTQRCEIAVPMSYVLFCHWNIDS